YVQHAGYRLRSGRRGNPPDTVADIVRHQQRAAAVHRHADRPAEGLARVVIDEAGEYVPGRPGRTALSIEGHKHHLVTAAWLAVPGTVLAHECAVAIRRR